MGARGATANWDFSGREPSVMSDRTETVKRGTLASLPQLSIRQLFNSLVGGAGHPGWFPLDSDDLSRATMQGRYAVYWAVRALLGAVPGDPSRSPQVLVPAYHHGVEVGAILAAGGSVRFYRVGPNMETLPEDVEAAIGPKTRAVLLVHHNGFPASPLQVAEICRRRGLVLLEDCAPALFSSIGDRPLGSLGDAACFSLHKVIPVPDGGVLRFSSESSERMVSGKARSTLTEADVRFLLPRFRMSSVRATLFHLAGMLLGARGGIDWAELEAGAGVGAGVGARGERGEEAPSGNNWADVGKNGSPGPKSRKRLSSLLLDGGRRLVGMLGARPPAIAEADFNPAFIDIAASLATMRILSSVNPPSIVKRRRQNFHELHRLLSFYGEQLWPESSLPPGVSPLFYPFKVRDRDQALALLWSRGIAAVDLWRIAHPVYQRGQFPEADELRLSVIELPVHQDLDLEDMNRIADVAKEALRVG